MHSHLSTRNYLPSFCNRKNRTTCKQLKIWRNALCHRPGHSVHSTILELVLLQLHLLMYQRLDLCLSSGSDGSDISQQLQPQNSTSVLTSNPYSQNTENCLVFFKFMVSTTKHNHNCLESRKGEGLVYMFMLFMCRELQSRREAGRMLQQTC